MTRKSDKLRHVIAQVNKVLELEYEKTRLSASLDGGTAGDEAEVSWANVIRSWVPSTYHVVTKGRIVDNFGDDSSCQWDVLVLSPEYPTALLGTKHYLAAGVAAAFECKLTLRKKDIGDFVRRAAVERSRFPVGRTMESQLAARPILGLLAHGHVWKREGGQVCEHVSNLLVEASRAEVHRPTQSFDMVCVANLATWLARKSMRVEATSGRETVFFDLDEFSHRMSVAAADERQLWYPDELAVRGGVIGAMLNELLSKLSRANPRLVSLAAALAGCDWGVGFGRHRIRTWRAEEAVQRWVIEALRQHEEEAAKNVFSPWDELHWSPMGRNH